MKDIKLTLIIKRPSKDTPDGYMGLTCTNMHPEPGETWLRGGDAADGKHNDETLELILEDIRSFYELGYKDDGK